MVAVIACGASFSEFQRIRWRFSDVTRHQVSHRVYYRQFIIRKDPILFIGDSITEMWQRSLKRSMGIPLVFLHSDAADAAVDYLAAA